MKPKYKYYVWEETPLTFYRILTRLLWIPLVIGTIGSIQLILDWISIPSFYTYGFFWYDMTARVCLWVLTAASIYFLQRGCWTGVVSFLIYLSLVTCNQIIVAAISSPDSLAAAILGGIIAWAILFLPCWIYFHKRRPIFYPFFQQDFEQADFTDPIHGSEQESSSLGTPPPDAETQPASQRAHPARAKYDTFFCCPNCGNLVKKGRYTCDCGYIFKRKINWRKIFKFNKKQPYIFTAVLIMFCFIAYFAYNQGYAAAKKQFDKTDEINSLKSENKRLKTRINSLNNQLTESTEQLTKTESSLDDAELRLSFWDNHAVIVTEHGTKYHKFYCYHLGNMDYFYIYNTELAESLGYTACKDCHPSTPSLVKIQ